MSEQTSGKEGPSVASSVEEVQGVFPSNDAMEAAIGQLTMAGFDRADFSLPSTNPATGEATPNQGASDVLTDTDLRQARNMGTGMLSSMGAMAAAGATIATGGAAGVAIAAAAAVGIGSGLVGNAIGTSAKDAQEEGHDEAARVGRLILSVHTESAEKKADAERIMRAAGATDVTAVARTSAADAGGIDSSSWTG